MSASSQDRRPARASVSVWQRIPIRAIILVALSVGILLSVGLGTVKTLTGATVNTDTWRLLIVQGIGLGAIYALIALGYTLVYGVLRMINFAHGEVFMAGAFGSYFFARGLADSGFLDRNPIAGIALLLVFAAGISVSIALLLERIAYRPLRNAPRLVPLITAIGASLFLQNTFRGFFGTNTRGYPRPEGLNGTWTIFGIAFERPVVLTIVVTIVALLALVWFVSKTRTGKSMRAVAEDKEIASLMGINVDRAVMVTFAVGGLMAGVAAIMWTMTFGNVHFFMGFFPGIKAFTAAVLGGIGSIPGAAIGGLTIGLLESVGPTLFLEGFGVPSPNQLRDVIPFTILVLVLIFRPGGILGTGEAEKV